MNDAVEDAARRDYSAGAMSRAFCLCAFVCGSLLLSGPALAQMYPGEGISVNPAYGGGPPIYPGAKGPYPGVIRLHMPVHHHVVHHKAPSVAATTPDTAQPFPALPPDTQTTAPADMPLAPAPHKTKHAKAEAAAATQPAPPPDAAPIDTGQDSDLPLALDPTEQRPITKPSPHRQHAQASAPQTQMASINPASTAAPSSTKNKIDANLSKRGEILFAHGETDPPAATINRMHVLAGDLNTLLGAGAQRVLLDAYGGQPGDKSSDARRISLKRALVIRQLLIENGVPSGSIDVRAMGGVDDNGAPDRVDVFVRA